MPSAVAQLHAISPLAGHPAPKEIVGDAAKHEREYYSRCAPGNGALIGGLKVVAASGWFAAQPSCMENIYTIYAESFRDAAHLDAIIGEAREMVNHTLGS